jgi:hypothetical protein
VKLSNIKVKNILSRSFCVISCLLVCCSCSRKIVLRFTNQVQPDSISTNWCPDIEKLDLSSKYDADISTLAHDVESFYENMRMKNWKPTYESRWKRFKEVASEATYLNDVEHEIPDWQLLNYDVLSIHEYGSDDAVLICRFVEMPGPTTTYSVVDWRKESDGKWRCDVAGPERKLMFRYLEYDRKPDEN